MKDIELKIDFAAALAKLAPAQLQGTWQLPTELTRLAIASGARSVELEIRRSRLRLRAPGARVDALAVRDLGTVLDEEVPASERHRALVGLEERDALALAALAALPRRQLDLVAGGEDSWRLTMKAEKRPRFERAGTQPRFELTLTGIRLDAAAAKHWLKHNGRFAPVPITLGRQPLFRGFHHPAIRVRRLEPLPAALAIARRGELPRLWLLRHGIISTRATIPGYPAFEAAVEMMSISSPGSTSATLREAVQPYVEPLVRAAVDLIAQLARHAKKLDEGLRQRAGRLLLEAAQRERFRGQLAPVRVFPRIAADGSRDMVSIADLERLARTGREVVHALAVDQAPQSFALGAGGVLVVSGGERALLGDLLGVAFSTPAPRPRPRRSPRRLWQELRARAAFAWHRLRGRLLAEGDLSPSEKSFVEAVRGMPAGAMPRSAVFRAGAGRFHFTADGRLLLPRRNPVVAASIGAVRRDAAWLYPVLVGLLDGYEMPSEELRRKFLIYLGY